MEKGIILLKSIDLLLKQGNYQLAYEEIIKVRKSFGKDTPPIILAKSLTIQSAIYLYFKLYDSCLAILGELEKLIEEYSFVDYRPVLVQQREYIFSKRNEPLKALNIFESALDYPMSEERKSTLLMSIITATINLKDFKKAEFYLEVANTLPLSEREQMIFLSFKGEIYLHKDDEKIFWKYQKQPLKYFETHKLTRNLNHIYSYLAQYYYNKNNSKKALFYYQKKEGLDNETP